MAKFWAGLATGIAGGVALVMVIASAVDRSRKAGGTEAPAAALAGVVREVVSPPAETATGAAQPLAFTLHREILPTQLSKLHDFFHSDPGGFTYIDAGGSLFSIDPARSVACDHFHTV